jgi:hypothetical protein
MGDLGIAEQILGGNDVEQGKCSTSQGATGRLRLASTVSIASSCPWVPGDSDAALPDLISRPRGPYQRLRIGS